VNMSPINLRRMKRLESGVITAITANGEMGRRIRDMGLVPGTRITIRGRAPLNDPVALRLMGFTLTLRNSEADYIEVEVDDHR
jgi:ferrous iron transport protein A